MNHRWHKRASYSIAGAIALACLLFDAPPAQAAWCAYYHTAGSNCGFATQSQCMAAISGIGGSCAPEGRSVAPGAEPSKRRAKERKPSKKKEVARPRPAAPAAAVPVAPIVTPVRAAPAPTPPSAAAPATTAPASSQVAEQFVAARQLIFDGQYEAGLTAM